MGCDIHFVVECRERDNPEARWIGVYSTDFTPNLQPEMEAYGKVKEGETFYEHDRRPIFDDRNYQFFANLAGVRGDGPDAKGVPEDVSALGREALDRWSGDAHSASYDTLNDFALAYLSSREDLQVLQSTEMLEKGRSRVMDRLIGSYHDTERYDYRVVYWFDN